MPRHGAFNDDDFLLAREHFISFLLGLLRAHCAFTQQTQRDCFTRKLARTDDKEGFHRAKSGSTPEPVDEALLKKTKSLRKSVVVQRGVEEYISSETAKISTAADTTELTRILAAYITSRSEFKQAFSQEFLSNHTLHIEMAIAEFNLAIYLYTATKHAQEEHNSLRSANSHLLKFIQHFYHYLIMREREACVKPRNAQRILYGKILHIVRTILSLKNLNHLPRYLHIVNFFVEQLRSPDTDQTQRRNLLLCLPPMELYLRESLENLLASVLQAEKYTHKVGRPFDDILQFLQRKLDAVVSSDKLSDVQNLWHLLNLCHYLVEIYQAKKPHLLIQHRLLEAISRCLKPYDLEQEFAEMIQETPLVVKELFSLMRQAQPSQNAPTNTGVLLKAAKTFKEYGDSGKTATDLDRSFYMINGRILEDTAELSQQRAFAHAFENAVSRIVSQDTEITTSINDAITLFTSLANQHGLGKVLTEWVGDIQSQNGLLRFAGKPYFLFIFSTKSDDIYFEARYVVESGISFSIMGDDAFDIDTVYDPTAFELCCKYTLSQGRLVVNELTMLDDKQHLPPINEKGCVSVREMIMESAHRLVAASKLRIDEYQEELVRSLVGRAITEGIEQSRDKSKTGTDDLIKERETTTARLLLNERFASTRRQHSGRAFTISRICTDIEKLLPSVYEKVEADAKLHSLGLGFDREHSGHVTLPTEADSKKVSSAVATGDDGRISQTHK